MREEQISKQTDVIKKSWRFLNVLLIVFMPCPARAAHRVATLCSFGYNMNNNRVWAVGLQFSFQKEVLSNVFLNLLNERVLTVLNNELQSTNLFPKPPRN